MSSQKFCQKFVKKNKLSSDVATKLSESVKRLLKINEHPTKSEIRSEVSSFLSSKFAKRFSSEFFAKLEPYDDYSDNDYEYSKQKTEKKSKKSGRNKKKDMDSKKKDKSKKRKVDDHDYDEYDDNNDDYDIYYSSSESTYTEYYYSDFDSNDSKQITSSRPNLNRKYIRDTKYEKGKQGYQSKFRSSTDHVSTSKTMTSPAYTSSEYQRLSKSIEQKKVSLVHRSQERGAKNERNIKPFSNSSNKPDSEQQLPDNEGQSDTKPTENTRQRFIIYVAGLSAKVNTVSKVYHHFHTFGRILGIQVNRQEMYALIEFNDLKSAYAAVHSKKPVFGNKLIKLGFASNVDSEMLEMFRKKDEEIEKQSKEMKSDLIFIDEDKQSDFSYDQSDDESYDMPDDA